jgi:exonuclease VII large subunit
MRGWIGNSVAKKGGAITVLVRFPEGTLGVVKAVFEAGVSVIDALGTKVDEILAESFEINGEWGI